METEKIVLGKEYNLPNDGKPSVTPVNKISRDSPAASLTADAHKSRRSRRSTHTALRDATVSSDSNDNTAYSSDWMAKKDSRRCFFCNRVGHVKAQCGELMEAKRLTISTTRDVTKISTETADVLSDVIDPLYDFLRNYSSDKKLSNSSYYLWQACEYVKKVWNDMQGVLDKDRKISEGKDTYVRDLTKDGDVEPNPGFDVPDLSEIRAQFSAFMSVANLVRQSTKGVTSSVLIGSIDILVASLSGMRSILTSSQHNSRQVMNLPRIDSSKPKIHARGLDGLSVPKGICQHCWQRSLAMDGDVEENPGPFHLNRKGKEKKSSQNVTGTGVWVHKDGSPRTKDDRVESEVVLSGVSNSQPDLGDVLDNTQNLSIAGNVANDDIDDEVLEDDATSKKIDLLNDEITALRKQLGESRSQKVISQVVDKVKRREQRKIASICREGEISGAANPNIPAVPVVLQKEVTVIPHFGHVGITGCDITRIPDKLKKHIKRLDSYDDVITAYLLRLLNLNSVKNNGDRLVLLLGGDIELNPGPEPDNIPKEDMTGWWTPILRNPTATDSSDLEGIAKSVLTGGAIGGGILGLGLLAAGAKSGVIPMAKFGTVASILAPSLLHMSGSVDPSEILQFMDQNQMIPESVPTEVVDVARKVTDFAGDVLDKVPVDKVVNAAKNIWHAISGGPGFIVDHTYKPLIYDVARSCSKLEHITSPDHFVKVWNKSTGSAQLDVYADHYVSRTVPVNNYGSKYLQYSVQTGTTETNLLELRQPVWIAHDTGVSSVGCMGGVEVDPPYKRTQPIVEGEYMWTAMTDTIRKELGSGIDLSNVAGGSNSGNPLQELIRLTMSMLQQNNEMFRSGPIYGHTNAPFRAIMRMLQYGAFYDFQNGLLQGAWHQPNLATNRIIWQDLLFPFSGDMMSFANTKIYATCCSIEKYIAFRTGSPSYVQVAGHNAVFVANPGGFIMDRFKEGDEWAPIFSCADMSAEDRAEAIVNELEYPFRVGYNDVSHYWTTTDGSGTMAIADDTLADNGHIALFDVTNRIFIPGVRGRDLGSTRVACVVFVVPTYASIQYSSAITVGNVVVTDAAWSDVTQVISNQATGRYWASAAGGAVNNEREMGDVIFSTIKRFTQFGYYSPSCVDAALRFGAECCRAYMPLNEVSVRSGAHGAAAVVHGGIISDDPNMFYGVGWTARYSAGCTGSGGTAAIAPVDTYHDCLTLASFEMPYTLIYTNELDGRTVEPNFIIPSSCFWPIMMSVVGAMVQIGKMTRDGHDDLIKSNTIYGTLTSSWHAIAWMNIFSQYIAMFADLLVEKIGITRNIMWEPLPGTNMGRTIKDVFLYRINELHWMLGSGHSVFHIENLRHVSTGVINTWNLIGYDGEDPTYMTFHTVAYGRIPKLKMLRDLNVIDAGKTLGYDVLRQYLGLPPTTALVNTPYWRAFDWGKGINTRRRVDPDGLINIEYWKASAFEQIDWENPMNKTETQITSLIQPSYGHFLPAKEVVFAGAGVPSTTSRGIIAWYEHDNAVFWHPTMNFVRWDLVTIQSLIDEMLGSSESLYDGTFLPAMTGSTWYTIPALDENSFYMLTPYFNADTGITNDENGASFVEFCMLQRTFEDSIPDKFMATENRKTTFTRSAWSSFRLPGDSSSGEKAEK